MATPTETHSASASPVLALPYDVLQILLAWIKLQDQPSAALACKRFCGVITAPGFRALRQRHGLEAREIAVVTSNYGSDSPMTIQLTSTTEVVASFPGYSHPDASTTDGDRLFFSAQATNDGPHQKGLAGGRCSTP